MFYFPPNGLDLRSTIFVYSDARKTNLVLRAQVTLDQRAGNVWHGGRNAPSLNTRTVVVDIKYFSTQNVIHTENCKLELPLDCSTTQMERNILGMCSVEESSRRRGFADFAVEVFYIDFDSLELLKKSLSSIKANIQDSPLFPGYKMRLNMESLLTLYVENQP